MALEDIAAAMGGGAAAVAGIYAVLHRFIKARTDLAASKALDDVAHTWGGDYDRVKRERDEYRDMHDKAELQLRALRSEVAHLTEENTVLRTEVAGLVARNRQLCEKVDSLEATITALQDTLVRQEAVWREILARLAP